MGGVRVAEDITRSDDSRNLVFAAFPLRGQLMLLPNRFSRLLLLAAGLAMPTSFPLPAGAEEKTSISDSKPIADSVSPVATSVSDPTSASAGTQASGAEPAAAQAPAGKHGSFLKK